MKEIATDSVSIKLTEQGLSRREIEVVNQVVKGQTNKKCAHALFVTEKTIKFHLTNVFRKMGLKNRQALILNIYKLQNPDPNMSLN